MPFKCDICSASFTEKRNLLRHINTTHNKDVFKCELCEFTNLRKDNLKRHVDSNHNGNMFSCTKCDFTCPRKDNFNRHMKFKHPQDEAQLPSPPKRPREGLFPETSSKKARLNPPADDSTEKSAFQKRLVEKRWPIRGEKDILKTFRKYKPMILDRVRFLLKKIQFKMDLVIKVRMIRQDKEGAQEEVRQMFYGGPRLILRENDFNEAYHETVTKIWIDFGAWVANGSGWALDSVEMLYMNTATYEPIRGRSYIPTPKRILKKRPL